MGGDDAPASRRNLKAGCEAESQPETPPTGDKGKRKKARSGFDGGRIIQACAVMMVLVWLAHRFFPEYLPNKGALLAHSSWLSPLLKLGRRPSNNPEMAAVSQKKRKHRVVSLVGLGDHMLGNGGVAQSQAEEKAVAGEAGDILSALSVKGQGKLVRLRDIVEAHAQREENLLGERVDEEEAGGWEDEGEREEQLLVNVKGVGREGGGVQKAMEETVAVEGGGGGSEGASGSEEESSGSGTGSKERGSLWNVKGELKGGYRDMTWGRNIRVGGRRKNPSARVTFVGTCCMRVIELDRKCRCPVQGCTLADLDA